MTTEPKRDDLVQTSWRVERVVKAAVKLRASMRGIFVETLIDEVLRKEFAEEIASVEEARRRQV